MPSIRVAALAVGLAGVVVAVAVLTVNGFDIEYVAPGGEALDSRRGSGWDALKGFAVAGTVLLVIGATALAASFVSGSRAFAIAAAVVAIAALVVFVVGTASPPKGGIGTLPDARQSFFDARQEPTPIVVAWLTPAGALALAVAGAALFISAGQSRWKRCPDCTKRVARDARACRFCGYRFAGSGSVSERPSFMS